MRIKWCIYFHTLRLDVCGYFPRFTIICLQYKKTEFVDMKIASIFYIYTSILSVFSWFSLIKTQHHFYWYKRHIKIRTWRIIYLDCPHFFLHTNTSLRGRMEVLFTTKRQSFLMSPCVSVWKQNFLNKKVFYANPTLFS